VKINNYSSFELGPPHMMSDLSGIEQPMYVMSAFHQLHCLVGPPLFPILIIRSANLKKSYLVQAFQSALAADITQEVVHHSTHCFDYLRQSIMCAADTSLEGKTDEPGWNSKHVCKDWGEVQKWANDRTVVRWRGNMPDEAVL
jgi:hypothetical protein